MNPFNNISSSRAYDLLSDEKPVLNCYIQGDVIIKDGEPWRKNVVLENCIIESFSAIGVTFEGPVKLVNCKFHACSFTFTYFCGGLVMDNCEFYSYPDFQAGGHNQKGSLLMITNNRFASFVNFFDCHYNGEVIIDYNRFMNGTNLLGRPFEIPVSYDVLPSIKNNFGRLDLNAEKL